MYRNVMLQLVYFRNFQGKLLQTQIDPANIRASGIFWITCEHCQVRHPNVHAGAGLTASEVTSSCSQPLQYRCGAPLTWPVLACARKCRRQTRVVR